MIASSLFDDLAPPGAEEDIRILTQTPTTRIERIVSHGHATAEGEWYDQDRAEFVLLLAGAARLAFEGSDEPIDLAPGAWLEIPAHQRHRVLWTDPAQPTIWLAVHHA